MRCWKCWAASTRTWRCCSARCAMATASCCSISSPATAPSARRSSSRARTRPSPISVAKASLKQRRHQGLRRDDGHLAALDLRENRFSAKGAPLLCGPRPGSCSFQQVFKHIQMVQAGIEGQIARLEVEGQPSKARTDPKLQSIQREHQIQILAVGITAHVKLKTVERPARLTGIGNVEIKTGKAVFVVYA